MISSQFRLAAALALLLTLSGCSLFKPLRTIDNWDNYQRQLAAVEDWQLRGKITVKVPDESDSARVFWQNQKDATYQIRLSGPLGQGAAYIKGQPGFVSFEQAGEPPRIAAAAEDLLLDTLDLDLPISNLHYWVRGIPAPKTRVRASQRDADNNLAQLQQDGWTLSFSRYEPVDNWNLPGRMVAERGDMTLIIVISSWTMGP